MSFRSHVCPPTLWWVGFFVYNGYPLVNAFFTRCIQVQLKKHTSGLSWFVFQFIKQDFLLQIDVLNRDMYLYCSTAVTFTLPLTLSLISYCELLYVMQLQICTQAVINSNSNRTQATCNVFGFCIVFQFCPIRAGLRFASQGILFLISLLRKRFLQELLLFCRL